MTEMKIRIKAMEIGIINEIYNFNNPKVKKIYAKVTKENEIEVYFIVDASTEEQMKILNEFNLFLEQYSGSESYGYEYMNVTPAKFRIIAAFDESNRMFASNIPIANKQVIIEIFNCGKYYKSEIINVVERYLIGNYEEVIIRSLLVSLDSSLCDLLMKMDVI